MKRRLLPFISLVLPLLFISCAGHEVVSSVSFSIAARSVLDGSKELKCECAVFGGSYSEKQTKPFSDGNLSFRFEEVPVGADFTVKATIYFMEETGKYRAYAGTSETFTVQAGENIIPLTLKKTDDGASIAPAEFGFEVLYCSGNGSADSRWIPLEDASLTVEEFSITVKADFSESGVSESDCSVSFVLNGTELDSDCAKTLVTRGIDSAIQNGSNTLVVKASCNGVLKSKEVTFEITE